MIDQDESTAGDRPWWDGPFRSVVGGRPVIVITAGTTVGLPVARLLREFGARDVMVYALAGGGPSDDAIATVEAHGEAGASLRDFFASSEQLIDDPPADVRRAVETFDPAGDAIAFRLLSAESTEFLGRPIAFARPAGWVELEDKTVIDAFFDRAGVDRKPSAVVAVADAASASSTISEGQGTVWAADARDGLHAGGELTRRVRDAADADAVTSDLGGYCDTVRVMPFVEGMPCSIHGIVLPDGVAVLRPVEMVVLRTGTRFVYFGASTYWDPPPAARDEMRRTARTVGAALAREVDFRGAFTLDGVLAADGFWPTEVNPRVGGGLQAITSADEAPPVLLFDLVAAGVPLGCTADELEARLRAGADRHRAARIQLIGSPDVKRSGAVRFDGTRWTEADPSDAHADYDSYDLGVTARMRPGWIEPGTSIAAMVAAFARFADAELGTACGELEIPSLSA